MARKRIYIKPFDASGAYATDWTEVTRDVDFNSFGSFNQQIDASDYDVGVFTNNGISLTLRNVDGLYSDVGNPTSIFFTKRADSLVKITWTQSDYDYFSGQSYSDDYLVLETEVFTGILVDDSTEMNVRDAQYVTFQILGYESLLDRVIVDFVTYPLADNKTTSIIKSLLAATAAAGTVGSNLTVDNSRIVLTNDVVFDDTTVFDNLTCKDAIKILLLAGNGVLYMDGTTPVVSDRTAGASVAYTFYGPASVSGRENISELDKIRSGLNRTFNFITWGSAPISIFSSDTSSIASYGARTKNISIDGITDSAKQQAIVNAIKSEFSNPKQEFMLATPLIPETLALTLLDRITIDFPLIPIDETLALYGKAVYGIDRYPQTLSAFSIGTDTPYKILGIQTDVVAEKITFSMRQI